MELHRRPDPRDYGLLIVRLGVGGLMAGVFGYSKLAAGSEIWARIGGATAVVGITFWPAFWGFLAAISEFLGGILLGVGVLFRPAALFLTGTMAVATAFKFTAGWTENAPDGLGGASHALGLGIVFLGLLIAGPGRVSVKWAVPALRKRWYG